MNFGNTYYFKMPTTLPNFSHVRQNLVTFPSVHTPAQPHFVPNNLRYNKLAKTSEFMFPNL